MMQPSDGSFVVTLQDGKQRELYGAVSEAVLQYRKQQGKDETLNPDNPD